ncbi:WhiB family transcriptional regulator [Actinomadura oligospora]|uniref:WhiB family transcriptional regulator n=1 Tax=Actinomadura oligospora TaxID=111804 RepID=UPI0004B4EA1F|nr:WhiB family transcriptional regulator [Actinomadura oligospora]
MRTRTSAAPAHSGHLPEPIGWEQRPCIDTGDELWFGPGDGADRESLKESRRRVELAKRTCAECPLALRRYCLEQALQFPADEQYGVCGGLDSHERRALINAGVRSISEIGPAAAA